MISLMRGLGTVSNLWLLAFSLAILLGLGRGQAGVETSALQIVTLTQSGQVTQITTSSAISHGGQLVVATGILEQERLDPVCLTLVPACAMPSRIVPILITGPNIYVLTSDDPTLMEQLLSLSGSSVRVNGYVESFSKSPYTCTPYSCDKITSGILIISMESGTSVTLATTTDATTHSLQVQTEIRLHDSEAQVIIVAILMSTVLILVAARRTGGDGNQSDSLRGKNSTTGL
jgi:hypothetical protein